jgi:hypothetical protein
MNAKSHGAAALFALRLCFRQCRFCGMYRIVGASHAGLRQSASRLKSEPRRAGRCISPWPATQSWATTPIAPCGRASVEFNYRERALFDAFHGTDRPHRATQGADDGSRAHAAKKPPAATIKLSALAAGADQFRCSRREVYLYCPNGYAKTKFSNNQLERIFSVKATTRNWNTVTRLYEIAAD